METGYRLRGLRILITFLLKSSSAVLRQTGIDDVFEDAVMPTLLFLPGLTPVEESLELLVPAYDTLMLLAEVRFPTHADSQAKMAFLDRIMRHGILQGFFSCKDQVQIVLVLVSKMDEVIKAMGIHAVLHLRVGEVLFDHVDVGSLV